VDYAKSVVFSGIASYTFNRRTQYNKGERGSCKEDMIDSEMVAWKYNFKCARAGIRACESMEDLERLKGQIELVKIGDHKENNE